MGSVADPNSFIYRKAKRKPGGPSSSSSGAFALLCWRLLEAPERPHSWGWASRSVRSRES